MGDYFRRLAPLPELEEDDKPETESKDLSTKATKNYMEEEASSSNRDKGSPSKTNSKMDAERQQSSGSYTHHVEESISLERRSLPTIVEERTADIDITKNTSVRRNTFHPISHLNMTDFFNVLNDRLLGCLANTRAEIDMFLKRSENHIPHSTHNSMVKFSEKNFKVANSLIPMKIDQTEYYMNQLLKRPNPSEPLVLDDYLASHTKASERHLASRMEEMKQNLSKELKNIEQVKMKRVIDMFESHLHTKDHALVESLQSDLNLQGRSSEKIEDIIKAKSAQNKRDSEFLFNMNCLLDSLSQRVNKI